MDKSVSNYEIQLSNGSGKSRAWKYFGKLFDNEQKCNVELNKIFCNLCLENAKTLNDEEVFSW